jgi:hypothetical protein
MSSPTARSLTLLRRTGYSACVVEKFLPQAGIRKAARAPGSAQLAGPVRWTESRNREQSPGPTKRPRRFTLPEAMTP